jgi:WD40 repeat protein
LPKTLGSPEKRTSLVFRIVSVYAFLMETSNEPGPEDFGSFQVEGKATSASTRRATRGPGQKRWLWIGLGGALHLGALAILGFYLWQRYQPAREAEEKRPSLEKSGLKVAKSRSRIDNGGSRLERHRPQTSSLDPPSSSSPKESINAPEPPDIVGEIRTLEGHTDAVLSAAFFPDGRHGLSGSYDGTVRIWNLETGQELSALGKARGKIFSVAISPDGHYALSAGEDWLVHLWDVENVENSKELFAFQGHLSYITTVAFSADGRYAISGGQDRVLRLWDVEARKGFPVINRHAGLIRCVAYDPFAIDSDEKADQLRALSCSGEDGTLRLWNVKKGKELHHWKPPRGEVWTVAWGPAPDSAPSPQPGNSGSQPRGDGRRLKKSRALVGSSDGLVRLWDVESWRELRAFPGHKEPVSCVAISPDGRRGLTGSEDKTIRLWDLETGEELCRFSRETVVTSVAFSPDGRQALSGEFDKNLHLWGLPK